MSVSRRARSGEARRMAASEFSSPTRPSASDCLAGLPMVSRFCSMHFRLAQSGRSDPASAVRILDVKTTQISTLPDSKGLFSPRWSPDGRYIVAMPFESRSLMLFDFSTQKWDEIAKITCDFPNWSKNSDYVYVLHEENDPAVMRVRLRDHKVERVADLKNFRQDRK